MFDALANAQAFESPFGPRCSQRRAGLLFALLLAAMLGSCTRAPSGPGVAPEAGGGVPDRSGESAAPKAAAPGEPTPQGGGGPGGQLGRVAVGDKAAVSSAEANATEIGLAVMKRGGNAVDAAVAVGFALGVTHPSAGNIGGGGFMVIRFPDGRAVAIDYREVAPGAATADMYLDASGEVTKESRYGPKAAGIPGVVAGLALAHQKYGKLPWRDLLQPAVRLARKGWKLDEFHAADLAWVTPKIAAYDKEVPAGDQALKRGLRATLAVLRKPDGSNYAEGEVWRQPALADTLASIAEIGPAAFYEGPLAQRMASAVSAMGGLWTSRDLAEYRAVIREPVRFHYRGHDIITMPPPSAGGVVLRQVLAAAERLQLSNFPWDSVERTHLYVEALRRTYADRNQLLGDPDFVDIPLERLLNVEYVARRMAGIDTQKATPSSEVGAGVELRESEQTTHFSVVGPGGIAVANTYTLNGGFGAKVQIEGTGVTLNNEMDDFTAKVGAPNMFGLIQGPQNSIAPGKRMLSSMTPTVVVVGGKLRAVLGSPGGPTITTTVAQILLQLVDHGRSLQEAVAAPRVHHQWLPDQIWHETALAEPIATRLKGMGHALRSRRSIGHANCIEIDQRSGKVIAVADVSRDGGKAAAF